MGGLATASTLRVFFLGLRGDNETNLARRLCSYLCSGVNIDSDQTLLGSLRVSAEAGVGHRPVEREHLPDGAGAFSCFGLIQLLLPQPQAT